MMLLARNALGYPFDSVRPENIPPTWASVVAGSSLEVLFMIAKCTTATTLRELWKYKVYYSQVLQGIWCVLGPWSKFMSIEDRKHRAGALLLLRPRIGCLRFYRFIFHLWILSIGVGMSKSVGRVKAGSLEWNVHPGFSRRGTPWLGVACLI